MAAADECYEAECFTHIPDAFRAPRDSSGVPILVNVGLGNVSPLAYACASAHVEVVRILLEHPDVNPTRALGLREEEFAQHLAREGPYLDAASPGEIAQATPLHLAAVAGSSSGAAEADCLATLQLLLGRPHVNAAALCRSGRTPLTWACMHGNVAAAKFLLPHTLKAAAAASGGKGTLETSGAASPEAESGADAARADAKKRKKDKKKKRKKSNAERMAADAERERLRNQVTPLQAACMSGSSELVHFLLSQPVGQLEFDAPAFAETLQPLLLCCRQPGPEAAACAVRLLRDPRMTRKHLFALDEATRSRALHHACKSAPLTRALPHSGSGGGSAAAGAAAMLVSPHVSGGAGSDDPAPAGDVDVVGALLASPLLSAEVLSLTDLAGDTPVHVACARGDLRTVQRLLNWAVASARSSGTPADEGYVHRTLLSSTRNKASQPAALRAVASGNVALVQYLLSLPGDAVDADALNKGDQGGNNALRLALTAPTRRARLEMVRTLLADKRVQVDTVEAPTKKSALHVLCGATTSDYQFVRLLLTRLRGERSRSSQSELGEVLNRQDASGLTALHHAIAVGHNDIVRLLLREPAIDINLAAAQPTLGAQPSMGHTTPICFALERARWHPDIVSMLLADPRLQLDAEHLTPEVLASMRRGPPDESSRLTDIHPVQDVLATVPWGVRVACARAMKIPPARMWMLLVARGPCRPGDEVPAPAAAGAAGEGASDVAGAGREELEQQRAAAQLRHMVRKLPRMALGTVLTYL